MNFLLTAAVFAFTPPGPVGWRDAHYLRTLPNAETLTDVEAPSFDHGVTTVPIETFVPKPGSESYIVRAPSTSDAIWRPATKLTFTCGDGTVVINLKTGAVTFRNCDPDETARQFWWKVMQAFPGVRSAILAGAKP